MHNILGRTQEPGKKKTFDKEPADSERHRETEEALRTKRKFCKSRWNKCFLESWSVLLQSPSVTRLLVMVLDFTAPKNTPRKREKLTLP
jgi:hypothetical protein